MTPVLDFRAVAASFGEGARAERLSRDPVAWVEERLGEHVWSKQREALESVISNKRTMVASCHGSGKTWLASRLIGWWLDTKDTAPTETRIITTAPSWNQVANVMWGYVDEVRQKAGMPGNITAKASWTFPGYKTPTAFGRKPSDYDESTFQGIHATNVLVVVDEAGGVPESIFTSVEAITTNANARILAIANPDDPGSYMAKVWREESKKAPEDRRWNLITISAFDTPNFTGEDVPERARTNLLQKEWVEDARVRWGETDPRWQAKVLAQFPDVGEDGLFNLGRVLVSMNGYADFEEHDDRKVLGVDVGLSITGDYSVIALNRGGRVSILDKVKGYDGNRLARLIGQRVKALGGVDEIRIDAVGVGRGVQAVLDNHLPEGTLVRWIVGNAASPNKLKWYNFRAAMYDSVSELINEGALAVPPEDTSDERTRGLYDEFRTIKYEYRGTALLIESKDSLKRRGESSPDTIDAICYASMPAEVIDGGGKDPILELTLDTAAGPRVDESLIIDEWGNEAWSFAPA